MKQDSVDEADQAWPSARSGWITVAFLCIAYVLSYIDRTIIALLVEPIKRDLGLTDTQVSLVVGLAFAVFFATMGLPLGRLADRGRRTWIIAGGLAVWSLATVACGYARSFWGLFAARVGVGAGEAALHPAAISLIADYFAPEGRGRALSVYMASGLIGSGGAYLVGGAVVAMTATLPHIIATPLGPIFSWQLAFVIVGLPGLLVALAFVAGVREPRRRQRQSDEQPTLRQVGAFLKSHARTYVGLFGGSGLTLLAAIGSAAWLPTMFVRLYDWTPAQAGIALGIIVMTCGAPGPALALWLAGRLHRKGRRDAVPTVAAWLSAGGGALLVACMLMPTPALTLLVFAPALCLLSGINALPPVAAQTLAPNEMRAQIVAIYFFITNLAGFAIGPSVVALFTDYVFRDESAVNLSIAAAALLFTPPATALLLWSRAAYARSDQAATWR